MSTEAALPTALRKAGIRPAAAPAKPTPAVSAVRRVAGDTTYYFLYNRSKTTVEQRFALRGAGRPFVLDTWRGSVEPAAQYTRRPGRVVLPVRIAPYDKAVVAVTRGARLGAAPAVHALRSSGGEVTTKQKRLVFRAHESGRHTVNLSNGRVVRINATRVPERRGLTDWTLRTQTWSRGANQHTTVRTDRAPFSVVTTPHGRLNPWLTTLFPVNLSTASGLGWYRTRVVLPSTWTRQHGAYLDLGAVLDTARVKVNGRPIVVNQSDRSRVDLGHALSRGDNVIEVRVATTMFNAVQRQVNSNYATSPPQRTGLMGPVVLTPYRDMKVRFTSARSASTCHGHEGSSPREGSNRSSCRYNVAGSRPKAFTSKVGAQ